MDPALLEIHLPVTLGQQAVKVFQCVRSAPCPTQSGIQASVGELAAQMLHKPLGLILREIGSDQDKFVAPHPEGMHIGGAGVAQALCHLTEQMVPRHMTL